MFNKDNPFQLVKSYQDTAYKNSYRKKSNKKRYTRNSKHRNSNLHKVAEQYHNNTQQNNEIEIYNPNQVTNQSDINQVVTGGNFITRFFQKVAQITKKPKIFTAQETRENKNYKQTKQYREDNNSSSVRETYFDKRTGEQITRTMNVTTEKQLCHHFHKKGYCRYGNSCWYEH